MGKTVARMAARIVALGLVSAAMAVGGLPAFADEVSTQVEEFTVTSQMEFPSDGEWKHSFDAYEAAAGEENESLARALWYSKSMEEHGVRADQVKVAVVLHGPAVFDVSRASRYGKKYDGVENANTEIVEELVARGAEIWVCGVAAQYHRVGNDDLLDGVKMAPSATAAHAELQRRGFGINPY